MIRVGQVAYLNTLPMFYNLEGYEIVKGHPSELFNMLEEDKIDVGILSSAVCLSNKDKYDYIDGISISGKKMVGSVLLFLKAQDIRRVYLTKASVTSRILAKWYIEYVLNIKPVYVEEENQADTLLYIGDKALSESKTPSYNTVIDLAREWYDKYGVGFVFALLTYKRSNKKDFIKLKKDMISSINLFYEKLRNNNIVYKDNLVDKEFFKKYFTECLDLGLKEPHKHSLEIFESFVKRFGLT